MIIDMILDKENAISDEEWDAITAPAVVPAYKYQKFTTIDYDAQTGRIHVILGMDDICIALEACFDRELESCALGLRDQSYVVREPAQINFDGALAEVAFARAVRSSENPQTNTFKGADICGVQIRGTGLPNGRLYVKENDNLDHVYVLLTGGADRWTVVGGITGRGAKMAGYKTAPNGGVPAWWVPQSSLKTLDKSNMFGHLFRNYDAETVSQTSSHE